MLGVILLLFFIYYNNNVPTRVIDTNEKCSSIALQMLAESFGFTITFKKTNIRDKMSATLQISVGDYVLEMVWYIT